MAVATPFHIVDHSQELFSFERLHTRNRMTPVPANDRVAMFLGELQKLVTLLLGAFFMLVTPDATGTSRVDDSRIVLADAF